MSISQQLAKQEETKVKTPVLQGGIDWAHRHTLKSLTAAKWAGPDSQAARVLKSPLPGRAVLRDTCEAGVERGCPFLTFLPLLLCTLAHTDKSTPTTFLDLILQSRRGKSHLSTLLEWRGVSY